ncbi:UDP-glucose dehydrogenase family protein [Pollutimonas bauzanensis]|uniref:UDP-glucose 6-dehydrogenase n=1 Tax=Pollutimonas bauzanensis TaxID=658167 RepID=A0A1M6AF55_9BURK|nr:UDP-glucose/GDP-mannose dehydrogenase family protein [Pollutimonas bauzanensis]SHI35184.1 UDPglucose 6-dehydrogenase [Pollutimonas bauzanensis]
MNVAIIGTGYVGLVTGACLAESGNSVVCIDNDAAKVASLREGQLPFHEPLLDDLVAAARQRGKLWFTDQLEQGTRAADIIFLALGTPSGADGYAQVAPLLQCAQDLAATLRHKCLVVVKSTVPPGTCATIQALFDMQLAQGNAAYRVSVASNPEFLSEGSAVADFRNPARIVVGAANDHAAGTLRQLYAPFDPGGKLVMEMDVRSAEFAKYACNAMLAARISLINELANIAGRIGADIAPICRVLRSDPRIGSQYLQPGAGYGGSCLPKDLRALIRMAQDEDEPAAILRSVEQVNQRQIELLYDAIARHFWGRLKGRRIAVWGLAFKPGTDDIREAPSVALIQSLLEAGARVRAYDPLAESAVGSLIPHANLALVDSARQACENADALVVMTEWEEFRAPDFGWLAATLGTPAVFDARDLYQSRELHSFGLRHYRPGQKRLAAIDHGRSWKQPPAPRNNAAAAPDTPRLTAAE